MSAPYRLELARFVMEVIRPRVKTEGAHAHATPVRPHGWELELDELVVLVTEGALLTPEDPVLSSLVDIWSNGHKVFSARWRPEQPWLPPTVVSCKKGSWMAVLGYPIRR